MLKEDVIQLLKETEILQKNDNSTSINTEIQYSAIYKRLIRQLDELMNWENADETLYESTLSDLQLDPSLAALNDDELLKYLENSQEIRRLIIQSSIITLPILRSIHHVEGIPSKETNLRNIVKQRDEVSSKLIEANKQFQTLQHQLNSTKLRNQSHLQETRELITQLSSTQSTNLKNHQDEDKSTKSLKQKLSILKSQNYNQSEDILSLLVKNGVNWIDDEDLFNLVIECGQRTGLSYSK